MQSGRSSKDVRVHYPLRLPEDLRESLEKVCAMHGLKMSAVILSGVKLEVERLSKIKPLFKS